MMQLPDFSAPRGKTLLLIGGGQNGTVGLEEALGRAGYDVAVATDGGQALRLIAQQPPDMIIVDAIPASRSEISLVSLLQMSFPGIPFLMLNECDENGDRSLTYRTGSGGRSRGEALLTVSRSLVGAIRTVDSELVQPQALNLTA